VRIRVEYSPEGGGDPKAIELYSEGQLRELTYEAMDEVLKADISESELTAITQLLDSRNAALFCADYVICRLADTITLSYESGGGKARFSRGEVGSPKWDALLDVWSALVDLSRHYFTPRFY